MNCQFGSFNTYESPQISPKIVPLLKFTYSIGFFNGRGQMAPQRHLTWDWGTGKS